jgi:preprotein translocase subunit SecG
MGLMGGSASQSAFGAGSADVLTKMTAVLVALFMLTGLGMALIKSKESSVKKIQEKFTEKPALEEGLTPEKALEKTGDVNSNATNAPGAPETKPDVGKQSPAQTKQETPANKPAP